jgi:hypothetical protein
LMANKSFLYLLRFLLRLLLLRRRRLLLLPL